jgi:hypothetical protein
MRAIGEKSVIRVGGWQLMVRSKLNDQFTMYHKSRSPSLRAATCTSCD